MTDIALTSVIQKTTDILANLLVEEFTRLYWLREDIEWLQREMRWIQEFLKDADARESKAMDLPIWRVESENSLMM
ncbi:hypothetical protein RHMOL_Rhmol01G0085500 [Rhododendron molle]|uniref:Uncharacterized protein n=1 Tax=Rhododendron molle TaxID=49168 RepID=A0ACC0Q0W1_RHOML|nr:hypothetical protein RHMOL_Rhmol01G0085500 [Rhododendron molle]